MTSFPRKTANEQAAQQRHRDAFEADVRRLLKALLPRKTRAELAAALTKVMGREITQTMIDNWVAEGKCQPRLPLSVAKALCELVGDPALRRYLNSAEDLTLMEIGEHARANKKLLAQIATPKAKARERTR